MSGVRSALAVLLGSLLAASCASPAPPTPSTAGQSAPSASLPPATSASAAVSASPPASQAASPAPASSTGSPRPSRPALELARAALDQLVASLELIHPEPYHGISREQFMGEIDALSGALPQLTPFEAQVGLQRVVALLSREGRDGHQFAMPSNEVEAPALPISVYEFDDGVFITEALDPYRELVGNRLVALNGRPIDEVLAALEPLVPRDGPATVRGFRPTFLLRTSVLTGLGLMEEAPVTISTSDGDDELVETQLLPVPFREWLAWQEGFGVPNLPARDDTLFLSKPGPAFWSELLPESGVHYIRYEQVVAVDGVALDAAFDDASEPGVNAVVLDLRQNPGGDNNRYFGILQRLRDPAIDRAGRLFVITDRLTFSAASNLATEIEQSTGALFAGESMGGGLNFWNDVQQIRLADFVVPMQVGVSTRYWQKSTPDDPRLTIDPDIPVPVLSGDYFAGRDPVMEAILDSL